MQPGQQRGGHRRRLGRGGRLRTLGVGFLASGAIYLLLIDTSSLPELYAGAGVTLIGALVYAAALQELGARMPGAGVLLPAACRALARIPADIVRVSLAAITQLAVPGRRRRGTLRAVPFRHDSEARRAAAEALGSLAPNTIVLGVDRESGLLLVHQLVPHGAAQSVDATELG